jgi:hypothetical protein
VVVSAAVNQADDKTDSFETTKRREISPVALLFTFTVAYARRSASLLLTPRFS